MEIFIKILKVDSRLSNLASYGSSEIFDMWNLKI